MDNLERNFSIYSILNEAPDDGSPEEISPSEDNEDDFDIDTSLDDSDSGDDNSEGEDEDLGDDEGLDSAGSDEASDDGDEPIEANTDIFSSLTAEEQATKIRELKSQYLTLYNSCDDLIEKVSDIETDENNLHPISRINNTLGELKRYIADYLYHVFSKKSFYENDVMFNRFLSIFKSVSNILEDIYKEANRLNQQNNK